MESGRNEASLLQSALARGRSLTERDEELRRLAPLSGSGERLLLECRSSIESLSRACELYAERPCFGERAFEVVGSGEAAGTIRALPSLRFTTYAALWKRVEALASGLRAAGLADTGVFVGICGFGSVDWVVADLACLYLAAVSVPLQTSPAPAELSQLGRQSGLVPYVDPANGRAAEADPLMTLMYTSGSTGSPKGAMFPESVWR